MIYLKNTVNGVEAQHGTDEYYKEIGLFSQSVEQIALVYNNKSHLLTSDARLAIDTAYYFKNNSPNDVYIRIFHKSDIDEVLIMASKLHNVDLIPINTIRN